MAETKTELKNKLIKLIKAVSDDDMKGMSVVDSPDEEFGEDDAAKWLAEAESQKKQKEKGEQEAKPSPKRHQEWTAPENLTDEDKKKIQEHLDSGYSEREAHRFAGTHKEHSDFQKAMKSGIAPSMVSDKMLEHLQPLAKEWLEAAEKHEKISADPEKEPMKHASGQLMQAHEEHSKDYKDAYHEFLNSDEIKNKTGRERHKAIREWKQQWKQQNPDYTSKMSDLHGKAQTFDQARKTSKQSLQEKMEHIMRGGTGASTGMTSSEAAQHVGEQRGEEGEYTTPTVKDPAASFASKNPQLVQKLTDEQKERLKRVKSAKGAQQPKSTNTPSGEDNA